MALNMRMNDSSSTVGGRDVKTPSSHKREADVPGIRRLSVDNWLLVILEFISPFIISHLNGPTNSIRATLESMVCIIMRSFPRFSKQHRFLSDGPDRFMRSCHLRSQARCLPALYAGVSVEPIGNVVVHVMTFPDQKECGNHAHTGQKLYCSFFLPG